MNHGANNQPLLILLGYELTQSGAEAIVRFGNMGKKGYSRKPTSAGTSKCSQMLQMFEEPVPGYENEL